MFVSGRRWNLILDYANGVVIKLPEQNFDKAYQKIALLEKRNGIFKRKLTSVDLRYDNKMVIELNDSVDGLMLKR
jgi:cell division protein FtsQ